ncbi:MAG TPA: T9SS type A sorting domain-containing protein [Saprospiraceae bacterium]|nr:T9SS type A sorting domain-containing protein [Saprospiraceae bacterium]
MKNVLILLFLVLCGVASGQIIDFPDVRFKNALVTSKCVDLDGNGTGDADADLNNDGEISEDEALTVIGLTISNRFISSLDGIKFFKNLKNLSCYKNKISSLDVSGLLNLEILTCYQNNMKNIDVTGCKNIRELRTWENDLKRIDVSSLTNLKDLYTDFNPLDSLNLNGLKFVSLVSCQETNIRFLDLTDQKDLRGVDVQNNIKLEAIFLKSGSDKELPYAMFNGCINLKYICADEISKNKILFILSLDMIQGTEVNTYCSFTPGNDYNIFNGRLFADFNNNGCDIDGNKISKLKYILNTENFIRTYIPKTSGDSYIPLLIGTHTITPILEHPDYFEVTPSSITITFPSSSDTITQDICIIPKGIFRQTNITVIPLSPPARPGFDASYKIVWENVGNQIESGMLNFTYNETLLNYISATQTADHVADGIIKWNFSNLLPFENREITLKLKVNRPTDTPAVNAGDKLYLTASILDNIFTLENTVVGSYDPNDKTCLQGDRVKPDMVGEYVDYLIRFENTGNYAAENVVVKDIIDTKTFDVSTLKITDASHEVYTRIEGNKVEFIFENIQLPFDDANNDGYIAFKIKTLPTLVLGDSLKNLADIYFDYNFPIRTNEAQTTVAFPVFTKDITTEVKFHPNPVTDILYLDTAENWTKAEIYDISGRILRSISLNTSFMDVSGLESGTYFIRLKDGEKVGLVKFLKI